MSDNKNLNKARRAGKNGTGDEFYTRYEAVNYIMQKIDPAEFRGKTVYCNCDWPESNFVKYFRNNFHALGLKKLIATGIFKDFDWRGTYYEFDGVKEIVRELDGRGEFNSPECRRLLESCDIVCTNPPFSLMLQYTDMIFASGKKYITVMSNVHLTYSRVLAQFMNGSLNVIAARDERGQFSNDKCWFEKDGMPISVLCIAVTNIKAAKVCVHTYHLSKRYDPNEYRFFDGTNILNVDRMEDVPCDYAGPMGIPSTALCNYSQIDRDQFEILGILNTGSSWPVLGLPVIDGKMKFRRLVVKLKNPEKLH